MVETKTRVSRLDGAETKADSRQRAKESQEQKEHPVSKDAWLETQEKGPSTTFISSLLAKPSSQRTLPPQENWPHTPWPSEVGSYAHSKTARMFGVSPVVKKGRLATALPAVPALVPFCSHLVPCTPGSPALVGTLPYKTV